MYRVSNLLTNKNIKVVDSKGSMKVLQHEKDLSVSPSLAQMAYFASEMDVHKRQVLCQLGKNGAEGLITQAGAMQWTVGNIHATTGLKGVGDFAKKLGRGMVTNESAIKPEYVGSGQIMLEPTYKHIILIDMEEWDNEIVLEDGMFLACENTINLKVSGRTTISSAIAGGEGLFSIFCVGSGILAVESPCPADELVMVELNNDELKIDGHFAIAWSKSLKFTVERSGKTLLGSAASGEGLVNVYRGSGRVLMMPVNCMPVTSLPGRLELN